MGDHAAMQHRTIVIYLIESAVIRICMMIAHSWVRGGHRVPQTVPSA